MTVQTNTNVASFNGNGVTQIFPIAFKFNNDTDLIVMLADDATGFSSLLTLNSDYTVSGEGDEEGGLINVVVAPAVGKRLFVSRVVDILQMTDLRNQGKFFAEVHEDAFDLLTMIAQQHKSDIARSLRVAETDPEPARIPPAVQRAGKLLAFDSAGNPTTALPVADSSTELRQELASAAGASMVGGAGQVVPSISALRNLLKTTPSKSAFVSGYYAQGDGGGGAYYLDAGDTTTADNGGTVIVAADGGRWKLSQQGMVSVKQFGAKGDGTTDDHAAVQSAHSAGHGVFYPEGTYQCSAKITAAAPFGLFGAGINRTIIRFTGATQGYAITQGFGVGVIIEGASFRTNATPSANHIGLQVNGQSQFSGTTDGAGRQIIGDRTMNRASVTNVDFRGSTEAAGWYAGLNLRSVMNFAVSDITTSGVVDNTGNYSGVGVLIDGDGMPVDWSIQRMWSFYQDTAVMCPDYTEGGHIYDFEFVNVLYGIRAGYVAGFSALPEGACGALGMFITQGHVNCRLAGVFLQGTNQDTISGLNLYLNPLAGDASAFGVQLVNGNFNQISGVRVNGSNAKNTKASNNGVILSGVGFSTIEGCSANGIGAAVALVNSSTINTLGAILANNSVNAVATDGTSTGNMIANTVKGVSLSGPVYSGSPDNFVERRSFSATTVQTLGGGTSFTFTAPVPAGYFTEVPDVAAAVTSSGATAIDCIYNYELSTATSLSFTVVSTSLPSGSVRFGISAEGR